MHTLNVVTYFVVQTMLRIVLIRRKDSYTPRIRTLDRDLGMNSLVVVVVHDQLSAQVAEPPLLIGHVSMVMAGIVCCKLHRNSEDASTAALQAGVEMFAVLQHVMLQIDTTVAGVEALLLQTAIATRCIVQLLVLLHVIVVYAAEDAPSDATLPNRVRQLEWSSLPVREVTPTNIEIVVITLETQSIVFLRCNVRKCKLRLAGVCWVLLDIVILVGKI